MVRRTLRQILAHTKGNVLMVFGLALPVIIGGAGIAVDTVQWALTKRQLQRAADSAALAGALAVYQSRDATAAVRRDLMLNDDQTWSPNPAVENAPVSGPYARDKSAVKVSLSVTALQSFSQLFMSQAPIIAAQATAAATLDAKYCVLALENTSAVGITFGGSTDVKSDCGMFTNSTGAPAVSAGGSASVTATQIGARGTVVGDSRFLKPTKLIQGQPAQRDPYAALPDPNVSGCSGAPSLKVQANTTVTLSPGCFSGMDLKGTVTFLPGVYTVYGDTLSISAGAVIKGSGVTFLLSGSAPSSVATLSITGHPTLQLTAPVSGTFSGVLFYQDRKANAVLTNKITGSVTAMVTGALYLPSTSIDFTGNGSLTANCLRLIARTVTYTGSSSTMTTCAGGGNDRKFGHKVRLVG